MRLKDKVAIVSGAGRGIGQAIALAYAREGAHVVVNDIDPATASATAAQAVTLGSKALAVAGDMAKRDDIARVVETTIRERGRVDVVVNNAMRIVPGKLEQLTEEAWDTTMNVGLKGAFLLGQAAARHMIGRKSGCVVNIASVAGLFPYNWAGAYSVCAPRPAGWRRRRRTHVARRLGARHASRARRAGSRLRDGDRRHRARTRAEQHPQRAARCGGHGHPQPTVST